MGRDIPTFGKASDLTALKSGMTPRLKALYILKSNLANLNKTVKNKFAEKANLVMARSTLENQIKSAGKNTECLCIGTKDRV